MIINEIYLVIRWICNDVDRADKVTVRVLELTRVESIGDVISML